MAKPHRKTALYPMRQRVEIVTAATKFGRADTLSWVNPRQLGFTCARCHANPAIVEKYHIPIKDPFKAYSHSVHGRLTIAGSDSAATCSSCHGNHKIFAANNPASKVYHFNIPQTCGQCHQEVTKAFEASVHGVAVARGSTDSPVCTNCHTEHGIASPKEATAPTAPQNVAVETCGRCHASTRIVEKYGMRAERLSTFEDSYHGLALRSGRLAVANCGSCHGVHDILPSSDPRSMINPANLTTLRRLPSQRRRKFCARASTHDSRSERGQIRRRHSCSLHNLDCRGHRRDGHSQRIGFYSQE
jgi:hypothetical protein